MSAPPSDQYLQQMIARRRDDWVRAVRRIVPAHDEAEDIVQETLAKVWALLQARSVKNAEAYIGRAMHLNALKYRARKRMHLSLDATRVPNARSGHDPAGLDAEPDDIEPTTLEEALIDLPETQQAVIRLKYYVGLSFREIGEVLAISSNTAASRCRYALHALRRMLGGKPKQDE